VRRRDSAFLPFGVSILAFGVLILAFGVLILGRELLSTRPIAEPASPTTPES
jgi:hypothetical protein